ncbi:MAG TPA: Hsp20/alpha crystallin family protein [Candidatus Cybelea sp.]
MTSLMAREQSSSAPAERGSAARRRGLFDSIFQAPLAEVVFPELSVARALLNGMPMLSTEVESFLPSVEISEKYGAYLVDAALPGFKREDIDVEVSGSELTISGKYERKQDSARKHYSEMRQASFARTIVLPQELDADKVSASFENGVLHVTAKPVAAISTKKVAVK